MMNKTIEAAARPTKTKTAATAPVLWKKDDPLAELSFGTKVGLTPIWVIVVTLPSLAVDANSEVTSEGVLVVVCPRLSVVVITTVLLNVVVGTLSCAEVVV